MNLKEIKRFVSYIAVGMVTVMSVFAMLVLEVSPFIAIFIGFFISLVMGFLSFVASSSTFTKIISGAEYGVLIFNSTGHLKFFTATIQGDKFVSYINGKPIEQKFNRNLFWYVSKKIEHGILRRGEVTPGIDCTGKPGIDCTGKPVIDSKNKVIFEAPVEGDNISNELFKTDYPFLIYNPSIQSFITKEWLFKQEYDSMFFNFGFELKQSIDEHNRAAGGITRKILDLIALKSKDPQTKKFMTLMIGLVVIILVVVLFGEPIMTFLNTILDDPASAENLITSNKLS